MDTSALYQQLRHLAANAEGTVRRELAKTLRELSLSLETPNDTLYRISGLNLQIAVVCSACDMGLFEALSQTPEPLRVSDISKSLNSSEVLTSRLLRYLASFGLVKEVEKNTFKQNDKTAAFAEHAYKASIHYFFDTVGPMYQNLPSWLAESRYQNITDDTKTAFNHTYQTDLPFFAWMKGHPERLANFNQFMTIQRAGVPDWLSVFPVEDKCASWVKSAGDSSALLVDVGGGLGHQCAGFRAKYPNLPGRVILQDQQHVVEHVSVSPAFESMAHDFWEPQPIQGAKFYYLRNILHDYPDPLCVKLLRNTAAAMGSESLILIDEMVIPNSGDIPWQAAQIDLLLMSAAGALERTLEQWEDILAQAGLKVAEVITYTPTLRDSVIVAIPI